MPLYDYDCAACGRRFEVIHGVDDSPPEACPLCGKGPVRKAFAPPAIHFKGSGWAKKERRAAVKSGNSTGDADKTSDDEGAKKPSEPAPEKPATSSGESSAPSSSAQSSSGSGD